MIEKSKEDINGAAEKTFGCSAVSQSDFVTQFAAAKTFWLRLSAPPRGADTLNNARALQCVLYTLFWSKTRNISEIEIEIEIKHAA